MHPLSTRRFLLSICAALAVITSLPAQQPAPANANSAPNPNASATVIQDPAEYKAYMAALNTQDLTARADAMEAFAQQYPKSVVAADALAQAMAAWQLVGNSAKVEEISRRLLALEPGNVRALAVVVAYDRAKATEGDASALSEMCLQATGGMREVAAWQKPAGMADADFTHLSRQMSVIFTGAAGFCALQSKDYSQARDFLTRVFALDPSSLQDVYQLALADLAITPLDANGFWYCGKAIHLAEGAGNPQAADGFTAYCKGEYTRYRGSEEGWDELLAASATQSAPPADLAKQIAPAQ
jgi:tetratricopeptide (TPR) repeat protein